MSADPREDQGQRETIVDAIQDQSQAQEDVTIIREDIPLHLIQEEVEEEMTIEEVVAMTVIHKEI